VLFYRALLAGAGSFMGLFWQVQGSEKGIRKTE